MGSLRWSLTQYNWYPCKKEKFGCKVRHIQRAQWRHREKTIICTPRNTQSCQKLPDGHGTDSPPQSSAALVAPGFWTFSLQNCGTLQLWCSKPPSLWYFVMAVPENWYRWDMDRRETFSCAIFFGSWGVQGKGYYMMKERGDDDRLKLAHFRHIEKSETPCTAFKQTFSHSQKWTVTIRSLPSASHWPEEKPICSPNKPSRWQSGPQWGRETWTHAPEKLEPRDPWAFRRAHIFLL